MPVIFRRIAWTGTAALVVGAAAFFAFAPGGVRAAVYDGGSAIDVIGQYDSNSVSALTPMFTKGGMNNSPNQFGFAIPSENGNMGFDAVRHRLFISDRDNNRVLVYNLTGGNILADKIPDFVLGQADFNGGTAATTQSGMNGPTGIVYDAASDRLFVAEGGNRRILVFDVASITNGEGAVSVLGQVNFTSSTSGATQSGFTSPHGLAYDSVNQRLFVSDGTSNRILVFSVASITDGENAVNVLGQTLFTASSSALTQSGLNAPAGLDYSATNTRLFVADLFNARTLIFDVGSIADGEGAVNVIGQANFTSNTTAASQAGTSYVRDVIYDGIGQRLFTYDDNNRIAVYDLTVTTDGENAANVLGQPDFTSTGGATTQARLNGGGGMAYDATNNRLYAADNSNGRVMIFDVAVISNGENAIDAIGKYDPNSSDPFTTTVTYTHQGSNNAPNRYGLAASSANSLAIDTVHHRLFVPDYENSRVLVYNLNADDTLIDDLADFVLGQPDFGSFSEATTQSGMSYPAAVAYDSAGDRLFVADSDNFRVLVFDVASISNGEGATGVIGQADFTSNSFVTTQAGMRTPSGLAYDSGSQRLFVASGTVGASGSNRVTVYDVNVVTNGENAIYVLGQSTFTTSTAATSQTGMNQPQALLYDAAGSRLFVAQRSSRRVAVYDLSATTTTNMASSWILGQSSFTTSTAATTQAGMSAPAGLAYDASRQRLFVADEVLNRVTVYDVASITNGEGAVNVLGQASFTTSTAALTQSGLNSPKGMAYDAVNDRLLVADGDNYRIMVFDAVFLAAATSTTRGSTGATPSSTPSVTVTQPSGGSYPHGAPLNVFWQRTGDASISGFRLSMSFDGGAAWSAFGTETMPSDGYFVLTDWSALPVSGAEKALVKVEAIGPGGSVVATGISPAPFAVTGPPPATTVVAPSVTTPVAYDPAREADSNPTIDDALGFAPATDDRPLCAAGTLLKSTIAPTVYHCGADGRLHPFPDERIFRTWHAGFGAVIGIPHAALIRIPGGALVPPRPGTALLKVVGDAKVYAVARGGFLRWIMSEAAAARLYGADWKAAINQVSEAVYAKYRLGEPIE